MGDRGGGSSILRLGRDYGQAGSLAHDSLQVPARLSQCSELFIFFFQAEDGIRDLTVTGVQTCALPISARDPYGGAVLLETDGATVWVTRWAAGTTERFALDPERLAQEN